MKIKFKKSADNLFIWLSGELDEFTASKSRVIIDKLLDDNLNVKKVIFNFSELSFMDSTGIGMLLGRYKKLNQFNIPIYITGANFSVEKILEISGLYKIMPRY